MVATAPRIVTSRLVLRPWNIDTDLDPWAALCADPDVMRFIGDGSTRTRAECAEQLEGFDRTWRERGYGLFAVELTRTGELLGSTGLAMPDFLPEIMPSVEIGWRFARAHWGCGYATEAAQAALAFGFDRVDLDRIVSVHAVGNEASANVMRKIGMRLERETTHPGNGRAVRVYEIDRPPTR